MCPGFPQRSCNVYKSPDTGGQHPKGDLRPIRHPLPPRRRRSPTVYRAGSAKSSSSPGPRPRPFHPFRRPKKSRRPAYGGFFLFFTGGFFLLSRSKSLSQKVTTKGRMNCKCSSTFKEFKLIANSSLVLVLYYILYTIL